MKKVHIKKPDIKGTFHKIKNLKKEDIKAHWKESKARRQRILEERRNSKFAKKMQPVYRFMNRFSLVFHFLLACILNFFIEGISRHSLIQAWLYMIEIAKGIFVQCLSDICNIDDCISGEATGICPYSD